MFTKLISLLGLLIAAIVYWSLSSVCNYNSKLETKKEIINKIDDEELGDLGKAEISYANSIDCEKADLNYDLDRLLKNTRVISSALLKIIEEDEENQKKDLSNKE